MSSTFVLSAAFTIGFSGGLRSMTAPAVVAWGAHLQRLHLSSSPLAFMGSRWALIIFTAAALGEFVGDLLPAAPARTSPGPLVARLIVGFLTGACLAISASLSLFLGGIIGILGATAGAFLGYYFRKKLVWALRVPDAAIAIPEDLIAVGLACLAIVKFH